jgi:hypothetical protein
MNHHPQSGTAARSNTTRGGIHWSEALGARGLGCVLLLFGTLFSYLFIYSPLEEAARQEPFVSSTKGAVAVPVCVVFGLIYTLFGERACVLLGSPRHPSLFGGCCLVVLTVVGFLLTQLVKAVIASYGYSF